MVCIVIVVWALGVFLGKMGANAVWAEGGVLGIVGVGNILIICD